MALVEAKESLELAETEGGRSSDLQEPTPLPMLLHRSSSTGFAAFHVVSQVSLKFSTPHHWLHSHFLFGATDDDEAVPRELQGGMLPPGRSLEPAREAAALLDTRTGCT